LSFEFDYRVLSGRLGIKHIYRSKILIDQEQHVDPRDADLKIAQAERERENTLTKQYQGKTRATKTQ
jgi:hypothetical protein